MKQFSTSDELRISVLDASKKRDRTTQDTELLETLI